MVDKMILSGKLSLLSSSSLEGKSSGFEAGSAPPLATSEVHVGAGTLHPPSAVDFASMVAEKLVRHLEVGTQQLPQLDSGVSDEPVSDITDEPVSDVTNAPVSDITDEPVSDITDEPVSGVGSVLLLSPLSTPPYFCPVPPAPYHKRFKAVTDHAPHSAAGGSTDDSPPRPLVPKCHAVHQLIYGSSVDSPITTIGATCTAPRTRTAADPSVVKPLALTSAGSAGFSSGLRDATCSAPGTRTAADSDVLKPLAFASTGSARFSSWLRDATRTRTAAGLGIFKPLVLASTGSTVFNSGLQHASCSASCIKTAANRKPLALTSAGSTGVISGLRDATCSAPPTRTAADPGVFMPLALTSAGSAGGFSGLRDAQQPSALHLVDMSAGPFPSHQLHSYHATASLAPRSTDFYFVNPFWGTSSAFPGAYEGGLTCVLLYNMACTVVEAALKHYRYGAPCLLVVPGALVFSLPEP